MRLLVVDLLAEREGFGKWGVREIVRHFSTYGSVSLVPTHWPTP